MPFWNRLKAEKSPKIIHGYKAANLFSVVFLMIVLLVSFLSLWFAWGRNRVEAESEAILLAHSIESLLHPEHIALLTASDEDLINPEYLITKRSLMRLTESVDSVHFAYLLRDQGGQVVFLVDSLDDDHPRHTPPGQIYARPTAFEREAFRSKNAVLSGIENDRWGTWISVFVPVMNSKGDTVTAILGLDFAGSEWYRSLLRRMIPNLTHTLVFPLLFFGFLWIQRQRKKFALGSAVYRSIFAQAPTGAAIMSDQKILVLPHSWWSSR